VVRGVINATFESCRHPLTSTYHVPSRRYNNDCEVAEKQLPPRPAMSIPNGLLSQTLCHYLKQGRTLNNILMRAAHSMTCFHLSNLNLAKAKSWKRSNLSCNGSRRDKVALRTTCNKNVKLQIIKIRTSCQCGRYLYCGENLNWVSQNLRLDRMRLAGLT